MSRFAKFLATVGATVCFTGVLHATGDFGPEVYLDDGGKNVDGSPEFYWDLELKRLAQDFHPPEKLVVPQGTPAPMSDEETPDTGGKDTEATDVKDQAFRSGEGETAADRCTRPGRRNRAAPCRIRFRIFAISSRRMGIPK